ncbi:MAG TPA: NUDIX hydrolase [Candidatus Sphingobacterium stercoripullorum]|uniref:NUDIX hydrolase n=1 Tax=Candidatus Sphingobacterium stercoripullorum TaxID=2838759 RepID=A0A9D2AZ38_9SPHI|nr:NUDIX hydrolase [Candidatus Sphingobacterium stercoripullorum]
MIKIYNKQTPVLLAVDCIVFGFDGQDLKLLLIKRGFEPEKGKWSLMGGFVGPKETADQAASRILYDLTGLKEVYLEPLTLFSDPTREPTSRTVSMTYFALIDIDQYQMQITDKYHPVWFKLDRIPRLIFDHDHMVEEAIGRLRYKASQHPILFELLPTNFTIPQITSLYEQVYDVELDKRNFVRKLRSTKLLVKQDEKDKSSSKKGAYYYQLDQETYRAKFKKFINFMPNPDY